LKDAGESKDVGASKDAGVSKDRGVSKNGSGKSVRKSAAGNASEEVQPGDGVPVGGNPPPPAPVPVPQEVAAAAVAAQQAALAANIPSGVSADLAKAEDGSVIGRPAGANRLTAQSGAPAGKPAEPVLAAVSSTQDAAGVDAGASQQAAAFSAAIGLAGKNALADKNAAATVAAAESATAPTAPTTPTAASELQTPLIKPSAAPQIASVATAAAAASAAGKSAAKSQLAALPGTASSASANAAGANSAAGSEADTALSNAAGTAAAAVPGGTAQAAEAALTAAPPDAAKMAAAAIAAGAATAAAGTTPAPQPAKAVTAAGAGFYDSNAAVVSPGVAGVSDAPVATAAPLSAAHVAVSSIGAQSAANLSVGGDDGKHPHAGSGIPTLGGNTADAAAGLSQLSANSSVSTAADAAPAPTLRIHASVEGSDFPQGLSERVSWMVGNGLNGARLQVNPPQLGPIELRISVQGDHAQVWMTTHSAVTRDALESSSPKLREMLGAQGFGQVSVDISQRSFQDRSAYTPRYEPASADRNAVAAPAVSSTTATPPRTSLSGLDAYA